MLGLALVCFIGLFAFGGNFLGSFGRSRSA